MRSMLLATWDERFLKSNDCFPGILPLPSGVTVDPSSFNMF